MSTVDMVDLGLFGLSDKPSDLEQDIGIYDHSAELENLFSSGQNMQNILDISLQHSGISEETVEETTEVSLAQAIHNACCSIQTWPLVGNQ